MPRDAGVNMTVVDSVIAANESRKIDMVDRIQEAVGGDLEGKRIGILGVSFKPGTDDVREAPSLAILPALAERGAEIVAYDPVAMTAASGLLPDVEWVSDSYKVAEEGPCNCHSDGME